MDIHRRMNEWMDGFRDGWYLGGKVGDVMIFQDDNDDCVEIDKW